MLFSALTSNVITSRGRTLVDATDPTHSLLLDPKDSPVAWFSDTGIMPEDSPRPSDAAKHDVLAWIEGGAKDD